jgi:hypothetical protein
VIPPSADLSGSHVLLEERGRWFLQHVYILCLQHSDGHPFWSMARCAASWRNRATAQPRNLGGGHVVSVLVRVTAWKRFQHPRGWPSLSAGATAIAAMYLTRTLHPPRGETALIVGIGSDESHALSYVFVVIPSTVGPLLLLLIGLLVNNIPQSRCYRRVGSNGRVPPMRV